MLAKLNVSITLIQNVKDYVQLLRRSKMQYLDTYPNFFFSNKRVIYHLMNIYMNGFIILPPCKSLRIHSNYSFFQITIAFKICNDQYIHDVYETKMNYIFKMATDNAFLYPGLIRRIDWNIYGKKWKHNLNILHHVKQMGITWCI